MLLLGRPIDQIVACRDGSPAHLHVPDPRFFELHKLWMADQEKRHPQKRPKDRKQGLALLDAVARAMPRFTLDAAFIARLPRELAFYFQEWRSGWVEPESLSW